MLTSHNIKQWFWLHKWSSLICTLFLLEICLTGLPLIFADEIDHLLNPPLSYAIVPSSTPMVNLDTITTIAKRHYPGQYIQSMFIDDDEPKVFVTMAPTMKNDDK